MKRQMEHHETSDSSIVMLFSRKTPWPWFRRIASPNQPDTAGRLLGHERRRGQPRRGSAGRSFKMPKAPKALLVGAEQGETTGAPGIDHNCWWHRILSLHLIT